jgi:hypothetical protein
VNAATVLSVGSLGPESIDVPGAITSTKVHVRLAGVGSGLAAPSRARTLNVRSPWARSTISCGESHDAKSPSSRAHSNARSTSGVRSSLPVNWKMTTGEPFRSDGPAVIAVSGGVVSGGCKISQS